VPLKIRSFIDFLLEFNASMKLTINDVVRHASGAD
jgi:hypothetical protein